MDRYLPVALATVLVIANGVAVVRVTRTETVEVRTSITAVVEGKAESLTPSSSFPKRLL